MSWNVYIINIVRDFFITIKNAELNEAIMTVTGLTAFQEIL